MNEWNNYYPEIATDLRRSHPNIETLLHWLLERHGRQATKGLYGADIELYEAILDRAAWLEAKRKADRERRLAK